MGGPGSGAIWRRRSPAEGSKRPIAGLARMPDNAVVDFRRIYKELVEQGWKDWRSKNRSAERQRYERGGRRRTSRSGWAVHRAQATSRRIRWRSFSERARG